MHPVAQPGKVLALSSTEEIDAHALVEAFSGMICENGPRVDLPVGAADRPGVAGWIVVLLE